MKKRKHKKHKSVITAGLHRSFERLGMAGMALVLFAGVLQITGTNAGFSDIEESIGNTFTATNLDARMSYIDYFDVTGMNPTKKPMGHLTLSNEGSLDFRYSIKYRQTGSDATLCDALILTAKHNGETVYDQLPLKDFDVEEYLGVPFEVASFYDDEWDFTTELPIGAGNTLENKTCTWAFDTVSWQTNLLDATQGFTDTETTETATHTNSIETGAWLTPGDVVINEVMWMGSTASTADEWIELRNMTGSAIPIGGWKVENAGPSSGTIIIPAGKSIPANGFFLIANYAKTDANSALDIDGNYVVNLSLNNTGNGNLVLRSNTNLLIDSALGTATWPAGTNAAQKQSMERNDIPGDGLLAGSWHACVAGSANGAPYWDAIGNNYGTPKSANLSPIVLNEFVLNPVGDDGADRPNGEWIELYNILESPLDVAGWYFTNGDGEKLMITSANTASGETLVPGQGQLVVYLESSFLDNDADTLSLMNPLSTPLDFTDDIVEDVVDYTNASILPEGKSFARFPDGMGIWLDPEATPGEENEMNRSEIETFQLLTFEACFENERLKKGSQEEICSPAFLTFIGMLQEVDDKKINDKTLLDVLQMVAEREAGKLADLLNESGIQTTGQEQLVDATMNDGGVTPEEGTPGGETPSETPTPPTLPTDAGVTPPEATTPTEETVPPADAPITPEPTVTEETVTTPEGVTPPPTPPAEETKDETPKADTPPAETPAAPAESTSSNEPAV
ncbi:MAG: lamin tail domain-containing protein [Candidatus Moraniibacteriota bacterium]